MTDAELLQEFAATGSESAFTTLVTRYAGAVHAAALRQTGDPHQAEEVMQAVFMLLARKASSLKPHGLLLGWLMQATRYAAADLLRSERRRRARETIAYQMNALPESPEPPDRLWDRIAPVLDACLARLRSADRNALFLRFFQNQSLAEVGRSLGVAEEAARKRVNRALDKLRRELHREGAATSLALLPELLAREAAPGAPGSLIQPVVTAALSPDPIRASRVLALSQMVGSEMAWHGARIWCATAVAAVLLVGGGTWAGNSLRDRSAAEAVTSDGDYHLAGFLDAREVHGFIRQLQRNLRAGDREAVATAIHYPLRVNGPGFTTPLGNPTAVLEAFEEIFTTSVAGEILKCPVQWLHCTPEGVMIGGGSVWIARDVTTGEPRITLINLP